MFLRNKSEVVNCTNKSLDLGIKQNEGRVTLHFFTVTLGKLSELLRLSSSTQSDDNIYIV